MKKIILFSIVSLSALISTAQCLADFSSSVSGSTASFTNTSSGTTNYNWTFGDGGSSNSYSPTYTYSTPGSYTVCLSATYSDSMGGFCYDSICQQITVFQDSTVQCMADFYGTISGNTIQLTNTSSGTNNNNWTFGDGGTSTATNPTYTYSSPGSYTICLYSYYVDSTGGFCDDSLCLLVIVGDSLDSTANLATISTNKFQLYPNPTNSVLNMKFDHLPSNSHALIVDLLGREMIQVDLTTQVTEVPVADFPSGIYIVQLIDANDQVIGMHKFVRE